MSFICADGQILSSIIPTVACNCRSIANLRDNIFEAATIFFSLELGAQSVDFVAAKMAVRSSHDYAIDRCWIERDVCNCLCESVSFAHIDTWRHIVSWIVPFKPRRFILLLPVENEHSVLCSTDQDSHVHEVECESNLWNDRLRRFYSVAHCGCIQIWTYHCLLPVSLLLTLLFPSWRSDWWTFDFLFDTLLWYFDSLARPSSSRSRCKVSISTHVIYIYEEVIWIVIIRFTYREDGFLIIIVHNWNLRRDLVYWILSCYHVDFVIPFLDAPHCDLPSDWTRYQLWVIFSWNVCLFDKLKWGSHMKLFIHSQVVIQTKCAPE